MEECCYDVGLIHSRDNADFEVLAAVCNSLSRSINKGEGEGCWRCRIMAMICDHSWTEMSMHDFYTF